MRTTIGTLVGVMALALSLAIGALGADGPNPGKSKGCDNASANGQFHRASRATSRICP